MSIKITVKLIPLSVFFLCNVALAQAVDESAIVEPAETTEQIESELPAEPQPEYWLDSSRSYVAGSADGLVTWVDSFFGAPSNEFESAYSTLRLSTESEWEEGIGHSFKVRVRGKVHLPQVNKRLSLVFSDEEGEDDGLAGGISDLDDEENTKISLSYKAREGKSSRIDYGVGLSSFKIKANVRFRYQAPIGENYFNRYTNRLYFVDGEGFGTNIRYELDRILDENRLIRWSSTGKFAEDIDGVEWSTQLLLAKRFSESSALATYVWTSGNTRPEYLTTSYGLGLNYRRSFIRSWLYYELEPSYSWRRGFLEDIEGGIGDVIREDHRKGVAMFTVRVEAFIEQINGRKK